MRKNRLSLIAISVLMVLISGCITNQVRLIDDGLATVEKQGDDKIKIIGADVYQQDGQTWVYGFLKQQGYHPSSVKAHVAIQIVSKDGSVPYEIVSEDIYVPRKGPGKGPDWKRFKLQLPGEISKDSQIKMTVHSVKHPSPNKDSGTVKIRNNP